MSRPGSSPEFDETADARRSPLELGAQKVLDDLQLALIEVLTSTGATLGQPRDVKAALGIHQSLAWKVHRFVSSTNVLADATHLPGGAGISTFLDAAKSRGVPPEQLERVRRSFDQFRALVKNQSGDRASLELMLAGLVPETPIVGARGRSARRAAYTSNSAVWGTQIRHRVLCQIAAPSDRDDLLDFVVVRGWIGMRRVRQGARLALMPLSVVNGNGSAPPRKAITALDPAGVRDGLSLLPQFCSDPLPNLVLAKGPSGILEYRLGEGPLGGRDGATIVSADMFRHAGTRYRSASSAHGNTAISIGQPVERAVLDIWLHEDLIPSAPPQALLYSGTSGIAPDDQSDEHPDLLPMPERVQEVGRGLLGVALAGVPNYRKMMEFVFERAGWDAGDFMHYRLFMDYPAMPTSIVMRFDLAEKPG